MIVRLILKLAAIILIGAVLAYLFHCFIDVPLVTFSRSTGACVNVELPNGQRGDCAHLPDRYEVDFCK